MCECSGDEEGGGSEVHSSEMRSGLCEDGEGQAAWSRAGREPEEDSSRC
jgi:hypothetical protein